MKLRSILLITTLIILFIGCKKNKRETLYTGTVVGLANGCYDTPPINDTTPNIPYLIKFDNIDNLPSENILKRFPELDSSCAASNLPNEYKIIGKRIKFGFRDRTVNDREFTCDLSVAYYQVILTQVYLNQ
ncbi:MAG: hypothetical protein U0U67_07050 [Chitinophagales bacterium]